MGVLYETKSQMASRCYFVFVVVSVINSEPFGYLRGVYLLGRNSLVGVKKKVL